MSNAKVATLLFTALSPLSAFAAPSGIVFVTQPQTIAADTVSAQLTIQTQDSAGVSSSLLQTGCLLLQSTSPQGQFSSSATNWSPSSVITMNKSTANKNFFYKDSADGSHTLTVRLALKPDDESRSCAAWPLSEWGEQWSAAQTITIGTATASVQPSVAAQTSSQSSATSVSATGVVPNITAAIRSEETVSAGAGSYFEGTAYGTKGEPLLSGVRYLWNFGDGILAEGKRIFHSYAYPGSYAVSLTIAYNYSSAQARAEVTAVAPQARLLIPGDGSLLLSNNADTELDVGYWSLRDAGSIFVIPEDTIVHARGGVRFSPQVMGFSGGLSAKLYFPNGEEASSAQATADSTLRGEALSPKEMASFRAPLIAIPEDIDTNIPTPPAQEEGEVLGAAAEISDSASRSLFWGSVLSLVALLVVSALGVRYVHSQVKGEETLPSAEEFEIE
jgi:hypothetical protein